MRLAVSPPSRLLVIKPSAVGDVVQSLAVLDRIHRHWPQTKVSWLITPGCADLVEGHPLIHEAIRFDRRGLARWFVVPAQTKRLAGLIGQLRQRRFDMVIDLQGLARSAWLGRLTGAPVRVGLRSAREGATLLYTHRVDDLTPADSPRNAVWRYLAVAEALGLGTITDPVRFAVHIRPEWRERVSRLLASDAPYTLLCPTTNWPTKQWPMDHVANLARQLMQAGHRVVVSAAPGEVDRVRDLPCSLNLAGQLSLGELVALIERAAHVVTADSGPMHIAAALARPLTALFGPTDPRRTGPFGSDESVVRLPIVCSPCLSRTCSHHSCMQLLPPASVLEHVMRAAPVSAGGGR